MLSPHIRNVCRALAWHLLWFDALIHLAVGMVLKALRVPGLLHEQDWCVATLLETPIAPCFQEIAWGRTATKYCTATQIDI
jgi:hypothetical protein